MKMQLDDNLMKDVLPQINHSIVASIDAIFQVLGTPDPTTRKTSLSEEKFVKTALSSRRDQLGVSINTRSLTISITEEKMVSINKLLQTFTHTTENYFPYWRLHE